MQVISAESLLVCLFVEQRTREHTRKGCWAKQRKNVLPVSFAFGVWLLKEGRLKGPLRWLLALFSASSEQFPLAARRPPKANNVKIRRIMPRSFSPKILPSFLAHWNLDCLWNVFVGVGAYVRPFDKDKRKKRLKLQVTWSIGGQRRLSQCNKHTYVLLQFHWFWFARNLVGFSLANLFPFTHPICPPMTGHSNLRRRSSLGNVLFCSCRRP